MKLIYIYITCLVGMVGCGGEESPPEPETVFDPLVESLDKARATQDLELERKRRIDEELEM